MNLTHSLFLNMSSDSMYFKKILCMAVGVVLLRKDLQEVDMDSCGSETFKEFKQNEFRPHY